MNLYIDESAGKLCTITIAEPNGLTQYYSAQAHEQELIAIERLFYAISVLQSGCPCHCSLTFPFTMLGDHAEPAVKSLIECDAVAASFPKMAVLGKVCQFAG